MLEKLQQRMSVGTLIWLSKGEEEGREEEREKGEKSQASSER